MASSPAELGNDEILYGYLPEYLDGELPTEIASRFDALIKSPDFARVPADFQSLRGRLQLAMQSYYLKESELADLSSLVQDPQVKATVENVRIEQLGRGFLLANAMRRVVLILVVVGIIGVLAWKFGYKHEQRFKPLEYLGYEAIALEEDAQDRLNLPSHDAKEVRQYLATYPGLDFKPRMLKKVPASWQIDGATVIDYEVAKVVAVMYENSGSKTKEKLFYFNFAGELSELPKAEPGNMRGLIFQTYASDELNLVAWQAAPGVVSLLVGRRSAPELAELASAGAGD